MKFLAIPFIVSFIILAAGFAIAYVNLADLTGLFVVNYDSFRDINFLGSSKEVYLMLSLGLVVSGANFLLALGIFSRDKFLSFALAVSSVLVSVLLFSAISVILARI